MFETIPELRPIVPAASQVRRAWIRLELAKRGHTLASLSKKKANVYLTLRKAVTVGHPVGELRIAKALGVPPQNIWPERFDARGQRIKKKPGRKPLTTHMERAA